MRIKVDFHIHSIYSGDSNLTVDEIIRFYYNNGFKAIAITDHDSFEGALKARKLVEDLGLDLIVILGAEISTLDGDLIVLVNEEFSPIPINIDDLLRTVKNFGGLTIAPHPFDPYRHSLGNKIFEVDIDVIEVLNASSFKKYNLMALRAMKILGKPGIACSDAHNYNDLGKAYTIIEVNDLSINSIFKAIKLNRIIRRVLVKK